MDANESVQATDDSGDPGLIEEGSVGEVDHPTDSSDVIARGMFYLHNFDDMACQI